MFSSVNYEIRLRASVRKGKLTHCLQVIVKFRSQSSIVDNEPSQYSDVTELECLSASLKVAAKQLYNLSYYIDMDLRVVSSIS